MLLKPQFLTLMGVSFLSIAGTAVQATTNSLQMSSNSVQVKSLSVNQVNNLSQKIGENEVERAIALARFNPESPVIQSLNQQYNRLLSQLKQLEPKRYQSLASSATQKVIRLKITELEAEYQQQSRFFIPIAPSQQILKTQISNLKQRLAQITKP